MEMMQQFEYPLPILKILAEKLVIETSKMERGSLSVDNIGSGLLQGSVMSNNPALKFELEKFSGNQLSLQYIVDIDGLKAGDLVQSDIVIISNGGEKIIPLIIKVVPYCIYTEDGFKISTLKDFLTYSKKYPLKARQLFVTSEFMAFLMSNEYEFLEIFDYFVKDTNKERALENFFVLSKLKNRAVLQVATNRVELEVGPLQKDIVTHQIPINKIGWGYVEADVSARSDGDWLNITNAKLVASGFAEEESVFVSYSVDTSKLKSKFEKGTIKISNSIEVEIVVRKKSYFSVRTNRNSFEYDDNGVVCVTNNTGQDVLLEIVSKENYIKFDGKKYFMGGYAEIPFTIKMTALQTAQMAIKKQPYSENEIMITAHINDILIKKTIKISVGKFMN